jgi:hypothetical protein
LKDKLPPSQKTKTIMKRNFTLMIGALIAFLCLSHSLSAQSDDGDITISITKKVDGEKKKFEKSYSSLEEMKKDKEYREFAGEEGITWIDIDESKGKKIAISIDSDDDHAFVFSTDGEDDVNVMSLTDLDEHVAEMEVEIRRLIEGNEGEIVKTMERVMKNVVDDEDVFVFSSSDDFNVSVNPVEKGDFDKSAVVKSNERLDEDPLKIKAFGHQLIIKYPINQSSEVKVSLFDTDNEQLFVSRMMDKEDDLSQMLDLSNYKSGLYLLELQIDEKKLFRKITIKKAE